jgi:transmembrane sensor
VIEGRVAVSGGGGTPSRSKGATPADNAGSGTASPGQTGADDVGVLLSAGEQLAVTPRVTTRPTRTNVAAATAWTQHQLILDNAPLAQVAEEFNRYSARKLVATDEGTPELRLSGVFTTDPEFLIRYLRERADIVVTESSTEVSIVRRSPP